MLSSDWNALPFFSSLEFYIYNIRSTRKLTTHYGYMIFGYYPVMIFVPIPPHPLASCQYIAETWTLATVLWWLLYWYHFCAAQILPLGPAELTSHGKSGMLNTCPHFCKSSGNHVEVMNLFKHVSSTSMNAIWLDISWCATAIYQL